MNWRSWLTPQKIVPSATIIVAFVAQILEMIEIISLTIGEQLILLLIGLLAIDALTERIAVIRKLSDDIISLRDGYSSAEKFFIFRRHSVPIEDRIRNAGKIDVYGASLLAITTQNRDLLLKKLQQGCKMRILLYNEQNTELLDSTHLLSGALSTQTRIDEIKMTLDILRSINSGFSASDCGLEVRTSNEPIVASMLIADSDKSSGEMRVELYLIGITGPERPGFHVKKNQDLHWFNFFASYFDDRWENAHQVDLESEPED